MRHLVSAGLLAACGGAAPAPDSAAAREHDTSHQTLIGNDMIEAHLIGGSSDEARIHLAVVGDSLSWNIHAHVGTQTLTAQSGAGAADIDFVPSQDATWNLILRNTSAVEMLTVDVSVDLYGTMTWQNF